MLPTSCAVGLGASETVGIAHAPEGMDRATASRPAGTERQTLRDWVHRDNAQGIAGLVQPADEPRWRAWMSAFKTFPVQRPALHVAMAAVQNDNSPPPSEAK